MPTGVTLQAASTADIPQIRTLAHQIWNHCYPGIISREQIDFMLRWMYAEDRLEREIASGEVMFFLLRCEDQTAGFAAMGKGETPDEQHLHKLYLLPECHGRGLGSQALTRLLDQARSRGARRLSLRVNRANHPAIRCYERNGFRIERQLVAEIGGGFVMDDYWMVAKLEP